MVFRFATVQGKNIQWFLRRDRAVTPHQLGWLYLWLCLVALGMGGLLWFQGAWQAVLLTWAGVLAVGAGFLRYARHARDGERIYLRDASLVVEIERAGKLQRAEFRRDRVWVEPRRGDRSLLEVSGQGHSIKVGRFVAPELRPALAKEIRMALRSA